MDETVNELLKNVRVASPCGERWDGMSGTDAVRSCERCQHKVYNLSEMTAPEAADLLRKAEGRLCVRFYKRADGTMMTKDCPVGAQAVQRVRRRRVGAIGLSMASVAGLVGATLHAKSEATMGDVSVAMPVASPEPVLVLGEVEPLPEATPSPQATSEPHYFMGVMNVVPKATPTASPQAVMGTPLPVSADSMTSNKSFLKDLPAEQTPPREDPFAKPESGDR